MINTTFKGSTMSKLSAFEIHSAGRKAADYFGKGFHCAEAVAAAALNATGRYSSGAVSHATAFGGGFGRTHQEICGALSGAFIVIGHLYGRRRPGGEWDVPALLGAELRQRFLANFGTTNCGTLRDRFGDACQMTECRHLTGWVTEVLLELLAEARFPDMPVDECQPPGASVPPVEGGG